MKRSEVTSDLAASLAAAQLEMKNPPKDCKGQVGNQKTRYVDLAGVRDAVIPILARHGLAVIQSAGWTDRGPSVTTLLLHASGQWIECDALVLPASRQDAQGHGSAITYARRYALMAMAGIVGDDDDDDGSAASSVPATARRTRELDTPQARHPADSQDLPPPVANASSKTPPQTGTELRQRIEAREKKLVARGTCEPGELLAHVIAAGAAVGLGADMRAWKCPAPAYEVALAAAKSFEARKKPALATMAQKEAIDQLCERKDRTLEQLLLAIRLPPDCDGELTSEQAARGLAWLKQQPDAYQEA